MSSELTRTLDSRERAALIARHIALGTGADECAISYWDRSGDRVLTYGYYPPARADVVDPEYLLRDFPETRRVLVEQAVIVVDAGDPTADESEVGYLRLIGAATSAMLPLVSGGETIGLVELAARQHVRFDPARLALAQSMANEAAMALETARLYERLEHQAMHDPLTGLPNRALFINRTRHALARTRRNNGQIGLLYLDLDHFKRVNDGLGHSTGDELLGLVGQRLTAQLRPGDTVARLGDDEFGILLDPVTGADEAGSVAERLLEVLSQPFDIGGMACQVRGSIGTAVGSARRTTAEELLANADMAMHRAKQRGKARWELFDQNLGAAARQRAELAGRLAGALERGEFQIQYQPIFRLSTGRVYGVEALVRWHHPERGVIQPSDFISIAEEVGLIVDLGRWILHSACQQVGAWQRKLGRPELRLNVNISARQLEHGDLVAEVASATERAGLAPASLTLEITETVLMSDHPIVLRRLGELKKLGVRLAIDDFGTGYSSLHYLQRLPIDELKIDKTFIDGLGETDEARELLQSIIHLAATLHLATVAEGVERLDQEGILASLSCDLAQGFALAQPHDALEIEALLSVSRYSVA